MDELDAKGKTYLAALFDAREERDESLKAIWAKYHAAVADADKIFMEEERKEKK